MEYYIFFSIDSIFVKQKETKKNFLKNFELQDPYFEVLN